MLKPDKNGFYGQFGGMFVPDTLMPALKEFEQYYSDYIKKPEFQKELNHYLTDYVGRPTPLFFAENLSRRSGFKIYLKREDLNHTGAHKINNTVGQILLAKKMGKKRIIAETGAGQHGVATATVCALMNVECHIFMGEEDIRRQELNVYRMKLMGANVIPVSSGSKTLKEATTAAIRDWMATVEDTHYIIGSALGPHPYPMIVKGFQEIISKEAKKQILEKENKLPDHVIACIGGGSNAIGMFADFISEKKVNLIGVEAAGKGVETSEHAASLSKGKPGVLHGSLNYLLQDDNGQIELAHSISAGLDYPGVGPELSYLKEQKRLNAVAVTDGEALKACKDLSTTEGIIPALETAHAFAILEEKYAKDLFEKDDCIIFCLSGRGDKDMETIVKNVT
tara:strand:+ start:539 stop:1723 length:1185 start_codon:yes stop_codon:yes gene_type:complete